MMKFSDWFGQATTGAGFATLLGAASSVASGTVTWQHALPLIVGGVVGLVWPENTSLQSAVGGAASSVESILSAIQNAPQPPSGGKNAGGSS